MLENCGAKHIFISVVVERGPTINLHDMNLEDATLMRAFRMLFVIRNCQQVYLMLGDLVLRLLEKASNWGERQIGWATLGRYHNSCHFTDVTNKYQLEERLTNTCSKLSPFFWPVTYEHSDPNSLVYCMAGMLKVWSHLGSIASMMHTATNEHYFLIAKKCVRMWSDWFIW